MKKIILLFSLLVVFFTYMSCSKSDPGPPANQCAGVTITVTAAVTNATTGNSDGVITATATGGTGLTYSLNGGTFQASGIFSTLVAGTYTISAKNANGCTGSAQFVVGTTNPCIGVTVTVTGTVTNATALNNDGSITVTAIGGTGFTYSRDGTNFQAGGIFSGLAAGVYTITAKTSNGCTGSAQFTVTNPCTGVTVTVTGTVTNATVLNNNGSINASATGGTGFTFSINGGAFQASGLFSGLAAGVYTITAKNSNGCTGSAPFTVTNPCTGVTVTVTATITNTPTGQSNGSINASATGGTGFTFSINGGAFQASGLFSNLAVGTYTITAKNSNGCTGSAPFTVVTTNPCAGVTITVTTTTTSATPCTAANGGIAASASGGTAPYTYNINGGAFQGSNMFSGLAAGTYAIIAKDANNCTSTAVNATVTAAAPGPLFNAVKQVLATNCALSGCHIGPNPQNGLDWTINCTIVANSANIKARAVDGNPTFMPPSPNPQLSAADKQKIVNWVNAGGQVTN